MDNIMHLNFLRLRNVARNIMTTGFLLKSLVITISGHAGNRKEQMARMGSPFLQINLTT